MREAMSSHSHKGLNLIADLCIIEGVVLTGSGALLLVFGFIFALILLIAGIVMVAMGYYLDDLRKFAWWVVIIINSLSLAGTFIGTALNSNMFHTPLGLSDFVTFVINILLSFLIVGYLLRSNVRKLFFE
ncbi:MAG: hypothetical protein AM325_002665 [Candidatus Thorarchaeota archaeon SMTZ1-45]|nr:MAG: hypothetical protein AM325_04465 [Candidatus Thorarchaeota archaeon SMTZ1-45]